MGSKTVLAPGHVAPSSSSLRVGRLILRSAGPVFCEPQQSLPMFVYVRSVFTLLCVFCLRLVFREVSCTKHEKHGVVNCLTWGVICCSSTKRAVPSVASRSTWGLLGLSPELDLPGNRKRVQPHLTCQQIDLTCSPVSFPFGRV